MKQPVTPFRSFRRCEIDKVSLSSISLLYGLFMSSYRLLLLLAFTFSYTNKTLHREAAS